MMQEGNCIVFNAGIHNYSRISHWVEEGSLSGQVQFPGDKWETGKRKCGGSTLKPQVIKSLMQAL